MQCAPHWKINVVWLATRNVVVESTRVFRVCTKLETLVWLIHFDQVIQKWTMRIGFYLKKVDKSSFAVYFFSGYITHYL